MSGGSYDYAFAHIEDLADSIEHRGLRGPTAGLRRRFVEHLRLVAKAAHEIEWVDSADKRAGADEAALEEALGLRVDAKSLADAAALARAAVADLMDMLKAAEAFEKENDR